MLDEIIIDFSNTQEQKYSMHSTYEQLHPLKDKAVVLWCDNCYAWVEEVSVDFLPCGEAWVCCEACCNGLIHFDGDRK